MDGGVTLNHAELEELWELLREIEEWFADSEERSEFTFDPQDCLPPVSETVIAELITRARRAGYLAHRTGTTVSVIKPSRVQHSRLRRIG